MLNKISRALTRLVKRWSPVGRVWSQTLAMREDIAALAARIEVLQLESQARNHARVTRDELYRSLVCDLAGRLDRQQAVLEKYLNTGREREQTTLLRYLRKAHYLEAVRNGALPVPELVTDHPLALDTDDTRHPWGAKNDNSIVLRFNQRLYDLLGRDRRLNVLDIGCAGGGFVRTLIDDGHLAVGLEGSDYPRLTQHGEWSTIPFHLHTCDAAKPFMIRDPATRETLQFDAITAWEFMEHIRERDLPALLDNIRRHLAPGGYLLCSIATVEDRDEQHGWVYHLTVKPKEWWLEQFAREGLIAVEYTGIGKDDWVRGSGHCWGDWQEGQGLGFHCALVHAEAVPGTIAGTLRQAQPRTLPDVFSPARDRAA